MLQGEWGRAIRQRFLGDSRGKSRTGSTPVAGGWESRVRERVERRVEAIGSLGSAVRAAWRRVPRLWPAVSCPSPVLRLGPCNRHLLTSTRQPDLCVIAPLRYDSKLCHGPRCRSRRPPTLRNIHHVDRSIATPRTPGSGSTSSIRQREPSVGRRSGTSDRSGVTRPLERTFGKRRLKVARREKEIEGAAGADSSIVVVFVVEKWFRGWSERSSTKRTGGRMLRWQVSGCSGREVVRSGGEMACGISFEATATSTVLFLLVSTLLFYASRRRFSLRFVKNCRARCAPERFHFFFHSYETQRATCRIRSRSVAFFVVYGKTSFATLAKKKRARFSRRLAKSRRGELSALNHSRSRCFCLRVLCSQGASSRRELFLRAGSCSLASWSLCSRREYRRYVPRTFQIHCLATVTFTGEPAGIQTWS